MKIAQFIPAYRTHVHAEIVSQMVRDSLTVIKLGHDYMHWFYDSSSIDTARNRALQHAVDSDVDYLFMQDSDVYAPGGCVERMLDTAQDNDATVVGAICGLRRGLNSERVEVSCKPFTPGVIREVDHTGAGIICIDVNAIRTMQGDYSGPWFANTHTDARHTKIDIGEDVFFCRLVKGLGGTIWTDGRVETVHAYLDMHRLAYTPGVPTVEGTRAADERNQSDPVATPQ